MTITIDAPWTYRTALVTIDYAPGAHDVSDEIAAAAHAAGVTKEADHDDGIAKAGTPRATRQAKG